MMTSGLHLAISPAVPATHTIPPTFSLSFSLRGNHIYYRGLNRDLPRPLPSTPRSRLSLCFAFVSVTTCPCHLIFSHPPHTRPPTKRHQSHHPNPISDLPIPAHLTPNLASSPHLILPHLTSPALASILFRLPRTRLPAMCFQSAATRLVAPVPVSFRIGPPMTLVQMHILRPSDLFVTVAPHSLSSTSITITILRPLD